jgi:superfamily II DNA or RNA helicase
MSGSKTEVQAYESQAIGRAHRQGQKGEVTVVRLIIKNSVEHEMYLAAKEPEKPGKFSLFFFMPFAAQFLLRYTRLVVCELI